jgi:hypothetical protein
LDRAEKIPKVAQTSGTVDVFEQSDINVCYVWVCNLVSDVKERTQDEEFEHRVLGKIFGP